MIIFVNFQDNFNSNFHESSSNPTTYFDSVNTIPFSGDDPNKTILLTAESTYQTLIGGSEYDRLRHYHQDPSGYQYFFMETNSSGLPISSHVNTRNYSNDFDIYLLILDAEGTNIMFASYFGGTGLDVIYDYRVDNLGYIYFTGWTNSVDFPTSPNAYSSNITSSPENDNQDMIVVKLSPLGGSIVFSTYLGGGNADHGHAIEITSTDEIIVLGNSNSYDFPRVNSSSQMVNDYDLTISIFSPSGETLIYSGVLGNSGQDIAREIVLESDEIIYLVSETTASSLPGDQMGLQPVNGGGTDFSVIKFNLLTYEPMVATFLGGNGNEKKGQLIQRNNGDLLFVCATNSTDLETTPDALFYNNSGDLDVFICVFDNNLTNLSYATYFGGSNWDEVRDITIKNDYVLQITGYTFSDDFPTSHLSQHPDWLGGGLDVFISQIDLNRSYLLYSSYYGGNTWDTSNTIYSNGDKIYFGGSSEGVLVSPNHYPSYFGKGGGVDVFIVELTFTAHTTVPTATSPSNLWGWYYYLNDSITLIWDPGLYVEEYWIYQSNDNISINQSDIPTIITKNTSWTIVHPDRKFSYFSIIGKNFQSSSEVLLIKVPTNFSLSRFSQEIWRWFQSLSPWKYAIIAALITSISLIGLFLFRKELKKKFDQKYKTFPLAFQIDLTKDEKFFRTSHRYHTYRRFLARQDQRDLNPLDWTDTQFLNRIPFRYRIYFRRKT
jgi:hypothetical protein